MLTNVLAKVTNVLTKVSNVLNNVLPMPRFIEGTVAYATSILRVVRSYYVY